MPLVGKPDIVRTVEAAGVELRRVGSAFKGRCPLHPDKHPSFMVYPDRQRAVCFGCGFRGDVVDFTARLRGTDTRGAMRILGIEPGRPTRPSPEEKRPRRGAQAFKRWCRDYGIEAAAELRALRRLVAGIQTLRDLELRGWAYHRMQLLEHRLDILQFGSDEEKVLLFKEVKNDEARDAAGN